jgi:hypothetical protein
MVPELLEATRKGTVVGSGLTEASVGIGRQLDQFAETIRLVPDALLKLVPEFDKLADNQIMMAAAMEAKAKSEAKGKPFDENKFIDAYRKAATDARTTSDVELNRKTQQEAIDKQTQLLNGQLGAGKQMLEAAGMFGKAGKTMLTAAKQMFNAAFKGTRGEAENIGINIDKKQEQIDSANERKAAVEAKIKKGDNTAANREELELWNDRIKTLEKEKALLAKQKELTEDKAALEDKMAKSTENFKEKFEAQQIKQNQLFLAKQTALGE